MNLTVRNDQIDDRRTYNIYRGATLNGDPAINNIRGSQHAACKGGGIESTRATSHGDDQTDPKYCDIVANNWVKHHLGSLLPSPKHTVPGDFESHKSDGGMALAA